MFQNYKMLSQLQLMLHVRDPRQLGWATNKMIEQRERRFLFCIFAIFAVFWPFLSHFWHTGTFGSASNRIIEPREGRKEKLLCQLLLTHSTRHLLMPCHACRWFAIWRTLFVSIFGCHFIYAKHLFQIGTFVSNAEYPCVANRVWEASQSAAPHNAMTARILNTWYERSYQTPAAK